MPFLPLVILGVLALVNLFVSAFLLWLSCKICRVRRGVPVPTEAVAAVERSGISYKRALAVVVAFGLCGLLVVAGLWFVVPGRGEDSPWLGIGALIFHVVLLLVFLRAFVTHSLGRAIIVGLLWQMFGILYTVGFVYAISTSVTSGFAVPTGAMSPALLGYHKDIRCPACAFEFPINGSQEAAPSEGKRATIYACVCPNCRQRIHFPIAPASYGRDNPDSVETADPGLSGGDHLLAGRGLLGTAAIKPKRFDVVVHQYPFKATPMLYVKRLAGLPGETLAIKSGDLYVLGANKGLRYEEGETKQELEDPSQGKERMHPNDADAIRRFQDGQFEILRKSPTQVLTMRHIVYDNDHPAKGQPARWESEDGWKAGDAHSYEVHADAAERAAWLRYPRLAPQRQQARTHRGHRGLQHLSGRFPSHAAPGQQLGWRFDPRMRSGHR